MSTEMPKGERPSQNMAPTIHEAVVIADQAVKPVRLQTKIQWAALGALGLALAGFVVWALAFLTTVSSAQAQTAAKQDADHTAQVQLAAHVEAIDAGRNADTQRLERKIDAMGEDNTKRFTDLQLTMQALLREQRAKR